MMSKSLTGLCQNTNNVKEALFRCDSINIVLENELYKCNESDSLKSLGKDDSMIDL